MCEMISFIYKYEDNKLDVSIYDLTSHSNTQKHYPNKTEKLGWYEGHYTKDKIECRIPSGRNKEAEKQLKYDYPNYIDFVRFCLKQNISGSLDLRGCDLKGIKLPENIKGSLYLSGCDLTNIDIPERFKNKIIK